MTDLDYMRRALQLAERGRGFVEPNPLVGAVIVRDGRIVGEGWHQRYGEAHAEVNALLAAGESARGATLYVTLEPCCHHGKTPPCTDAVIAAGIVRVVAALADPFPQVAGKGIAQLQEAGIFIEIGVGGHEARVQNAPYLCLMEHGRPWVHAKWAMTLDGRIATRTGHSQWISNEYSRRLVHELRGWMDAVIVGRGTVVFDDPLLTARPPGPRTALRVIVTATGNLPNDRRILRTLDQGPVLLATTPAGAELLRDWEDAGVEVYAFDEGKVLPQLLAELGRRRLTNVLVEGGAGLLGAFRDAEMIDEVHAFIAPRLIGGAEAIGPINGVGVPFISDGQGLQVLEARSIAGDVYIHARRHIHPLSR